MKSWIVVFLAIFLSETSGEHSSDCTPGAILEHPHDCSKYYVCDADNDRSTFQCPSGLLYNPQTTTCAPEEEVTCSVTEEKVEETTTVDVDGRDYSRGDVKDVTVEKTRQSDEPEQHKGFYFLEDSSDGSSESGVSTTDDIQNQDEMIMNGQAFSSNIGHSEEGIHVNVKSIPGIHKEEVSEENKNNKESYSLDLSENPLDPESHEVKEVSEFKPNTSDVFHDPAETIERDFESKEIQDHELSAEDDDTTDVYKKDERLKKREDSVKNAVPKSSENKKEEETEDSLDIVEDKKIGSILQGEELNITLPSTNDLGYHITNVDDTNVLSLGSLQEPIANWTERVQNGLTDLVIFWKHPEDENFKGSLILKYPSDSMSEKLEINDLVLDILDLANRPQDSDIDETNAEDNPKEDNPQRTSETGAQTT